MRIGRKTENTGKKAIYKILLMFQVCETHQGASEQAGNEFMALVQQWWDVISWWIPAR